MTADRAELLAQIQTPDPRFDDKVNAVLTALAEFQNGFPVDQVCPGCGGPVRIEGKGNPVCAWTTDCPCHACQSTFRGL